MKHMGPAEVRWANDGTKHLWAKLASMIVLLAPQLSRTLFLVFFIEIYSYLLMKTKNPAEIEWPHARP